MHKITLINLVLKDYFDLNKTAKIVQAIDMMPYFVLAGVFKKDEKNGLPVRNFLKKLYDKNQLSLIPFAVAERKNIYIKWYFKSENCSLKKIVSIQDKLLKKKKVVTKKNNNKLF